MYIIQMNFLCIFLTIATLKVLGKYMYWS